MKSFAFFSLFTLLLLTSCGPTYTPFTQRLYEDYDWNEEELRRIQFYLSEDIRLLREYRGGASEIVAGEITIVEGLDREEIVIPAGTPGVFLFSPRRNRFAVSFEQGDEEHFLMFGPNPKMGDRYALLASSWGRSAGRVTYGGAKYQVSSRSAYAGLMVDLKRIRRDSRQSRVADGHVVGY